MKLREYEKCPRCGAMFTCGKSGKCWCFEIEVPPSVLENIEKEYNSCLCPSCLKDVAESKRF